jgi:hypothetical protein
VVVSAWRRDYPAAIAGPRSNEASSATLALVWFADQVLALGGEPLVYLPTKSSVRDDHVLAHVVRSDAVTTHSWRTLTEDSWEGGVVLAAWPDAPRLARIANDERTRALCVLSCETHDLSQWQSVARPVALITPTST